MGYGGTKEEMARLITDAAKLDKSIDANSTSFANVVKAIHAVQVEMGISGISFEEYTELVDSGAMTAEEAFELMGTTAKEGATTISGSLSMTKAAWSNLITGIADDSADFDILISNMGESVSAFASNLLPRIEIALHGIGRLIEKVAPIIIEKLPGLTETLVPQIINVATSLVNSITAVLPSLITTIIDALIDNAPALINAGFELIGSLLSVIEDEATQKKLLDGGGKIVKELVIGVLNLLPRVLSLGLDLIIELASGIGIALQDQKFIQAIVNVIEEIANILTDEQTLNGLLDAGVTILTSLADAITTILDPLTDAMIAIIEAMVEWSSNPENLTKLWKMAAYVITELGAAIIGNAATIVPAASELVSTMVEEILETDWLEVGKEILEGIVTGFKAAWTDSLSDKYNLANDFALELVNKFFPFIETNREAQQKEAEREQAEYQASLTDRELAEQQLKAEYFANSDMGLSMGLSQPTSPTINIYAQSTDPAEIMEEAMAALERNTFLGVR